MAKHEILYIIHPTLKKKLKRFGKARFDSILTGQRKSLLKQKIGKMSSLYVFNQDFARTLPHRKR